MKKLSNLLLVTLLLTTLTVGQSQDDYEETPVVSTSEGAMEAVEERAVLQREIGVVPPERGFFEILCEEGGREVLVAQLNLEDGEFVPDALDRLEDQVCQYYTGDGPTCFIDPSHESADSTGGIFRVGSTNPPRGYTRPMDYLSVSSTYANAGLDFSDTSSAAGLIILDFFGFDGEPISSRQIIDFFENNVTSADDLVQLPHGYSVLYHTLSALTAVSEYRGVSSAFLFGDEVIIDENQQIFLLPVNLEDPRTADISVYLNSAITTLQTSEAERVVVNMSFGLLPCRFLEDIENRVGEVNIASYVLALGGELIGIDDPTDLRVRGVGRRLMEVFFGVAAHRVTGDPDPLNSLLRNDGSITYIAAAGNFGLAYPMFPGAWEPVTSVSANDYGRSNNGEIASFGGSVQFLEDYTNLSRGLSDFATLGTSYAAPIVSVFAALDMASQTQVCTYTTPELNHWDVPSNPVSSPNPPENHFLPDAVNNRCP
jgi:hypothetical protein